MSEISILRESIDACGSVLELEINIANLFSEFWMISSIVDEAWVPCIICVALFQIFVEHSPEVNNIHKFGLYLTEMSNAYTVGVFNDF